MDVFFNMTTLRIKYRNLPQSQQMFQPLGHQEVGMSLLK